MTVDVGGGAAVGALGVGTAADRQSGTTAQGQQPTANSQQRPSGPIPTSAVAAALGVSPQTVNNYKRLGMKPAVSDTRGDFWDLAKVTQWIKKNRPITGRGGVRSRAGRPPRWKTAGLPGPPGVDFVVSPLGKAAAAAPEAEKEKPPPPPSPEMEAAWTAFYQGSADAVQLRLVAGVPLYRAATPAEGKHLNEMGAAHEKNRKAAVEKKVLVEAETVKAELVEFLGRVRVRLSSLVTRASAKVMAEGQVAGDREPRVRAAIAAEVESVVAELCGGGGGKLEKINGEA